MIKPLAITLFWLALIVGCAKDEDSTVEAVAQLAADSGLGHPDVFARVFDPATQVAYSSRSNEDKIVALVAGAKAEIGLSGFKPDRLLLPSEWAGQLWVLGHTSTGTFEVRSLTDVTGDGIVDASSSQTLLSGDRPDRVGYFAFDEETGALYLHETVTGHVFLALDSNSDKRPDQLLATPFVDGAWPGPPGGLLGDSPAYTIQDDLVSGEPVTMPSGWMSFAIGLTDAGADRVFVRGPHEWAVDTDGDHVADALVPLVQIEQPVFYTSLVAGIDKVRLHGHEGASLSLVEDNGVVHGETTPGGWVQLNTSLVEGQRLQIVDGTNNEESGFLQVGPRRVYAHEVGVITTGTAKSVTITGANLDLVATAKLEREGVSQALTFQFVSAWELQVDLPAMGTGWDEPTHIVLAPAATFDELDPETFPDTVGVERCPHE